MIGEWIKRGDDALCRAKMNGRNRSVEGMLVLPAGALGVTAMIKMLAALHKIAPVLSRT